MKTRSVKEVAAGLGPLLDGLTHDHEAIVVERDGVPVAVVVSPAAYGLEDETDALLRVPENAAAIRQGIAEMQAGKVARKRFEDLLS